VNALGEKALACIQEAASENDDRRCAITGFNVLSFGQLHKLKDPPLGQSSTTDEKKGSS
jgi:hypothetical protein